MKKVKDTKILKGRELETEVFKGRGWGIFMRFSKDNDGTPDQQILKIRPTLRTERGNEIILQKRKKRKRKDIVVEKRGGIIKKSLEEGGEEGHRNNKYLKLVEEQEIAKKKKEENDSRAYNDLFTNTSCCFCGNNDSSEFTRNKEYETVCLRCAAVQNGAGFFQEPPEIPKKTRVKSRYETRSYTAERLKQAANLEPRIDSEDLYIIRQAFLQLTERDPTCKTLIPEKETFQRARVEDNRNSWDPLGDSWISKTLIKSVLSEIDKLILKKDSNLSKIYSKAQFKKKYTERWLQIKYYLLNAKNDRRGGVCMTKEGVADVHELLTIITDCYQDEEIGRGPVKIKTSSLSVDIGILLTLYSYDISQLRLFGWYFVRDTVFRLSKNSFAYLDFDEYREVLKVLNTQIERFPRQTEYFTHKLEIGKFRIPESLEEILTECKVNKTYYGLGH